MEIRRESTTPCRSAEELWPLLDPWEGRLAVWKVLKGELLLRQLCLDVHWAQATGAGAVLSFVTGDKALSERIVGGTRLWGISVSFGAVNSLISMPCLMS